LLPTASLSDISLQVLLANLDHPQEMQDPDPEWQRLRKCLGDLRAAGVEVQSVASLGAAAAALGLKCQPPPLAKPKRRPWLAGLAAALLVGWFGLDFYRFLNQPITLGDGRPFRPQIACVDAKDDVTLTRPPVAIRKSQVGGESMPVVPPHAQLALEIRIGTAEEAESWQRGLLRLLGHSGYQTAVVLVGERSGMQPGLSLRDKQNK
jgi:hypothetical protein